MNSRRSSWGKPRNQQQSHWLFTLACIITFVIIGLVVSVELGVTSIPELAAAADLGEPATR